MDVVLLRFDAPLMSFGGVVVDQENKTDALPYRAMLAGLVANALGLTRRDEESFAGLQRRIRYAARLDRPGSVLVDYHTVDFDAEGPMASDLAWTSSNRIEERRGGEASAGTHIRFRHYLADAIVTVALTLDPATDSPSLAAVSAALRSPARPLFLGRKCCIPSGPVWLGEMAAESLRQAISTVPRAAPLTAGDEARAHAGALRAVWPQSEGADEDRARLWPRVEDRDPANAIHVGRRLYFDGIVDPGPRGA
ncbi:MAG TPA: type I-E CRISPR-associated protein Cas5/CasD [Polyangiaceae bacterium]